MIASTSPATNLINLLLTKRSLFLAGLVALIGASIVNLSLPWVIRELLKPESLSWTAQNPTAVIAIFGTLFGIQAILYYYRALTFQRLGSEIGALLRERLYKVVIQQDLAFFDRRHSGELSTLLSNDTQMVQDAVATKLSVLLRYSLQVLAGICLMVYLSPLLSASILIIVPVLVLFSVSLAKKLKASSRKLQDQLSNLGALAQETFRGVRIVKAFGEEQSESNRFNTNSALTLGTALERTKIAAFFASFVSFLMNCSLVGVFLIGLLLVNQGKLSLADLAAFSLYGAIVAASFAFVAGSYTEFLQALAGAGRVFDLLALEERPEVQISDSDQETSPSQLSGAQIIFDRVSFAFPSRPEVQVLKEVSFSLRAGKVTALVGSSGAGKSTVVQLLLRFYPYLSGSIKWNEKEISELSERTLRKQIAYVPQDVLLFSLTLRENICYGLGREVTEKALSEVIKIVGLADLLAQLPQGIDSKVGEGGSQLSGGQRQRLSLARALLRRPALLILDEATSALDSESEHFIHEAIFEHLKGCTILTIAHRLATVQHADHIVVLAKGKVVQEGNHNQLSNQDGLYRTLVLTQSLV